MLACALSIPMDDLGLTVSVMTERINLQQLQCLRGHIPSLSQCCVCPVSMCLCAVCLGLLPTICIRLWLCSLKRPGASVAQAALA